MYTASQVYMDFVHSSEYEAPTGHIQYALWDGEMIVDAFIDCGAHGFYSAVIVVSRCDDPLEVRKWSGYQSGPENRPTADDAAQWVANQLNNLATGVAGTSTVILQ